MSANTEAMSKARVLVAQMIEIVDAVEMGYVQVAGMQQSIDAGVKNQAKLAFNAKRADLIKAVNDVKFNG